MSRFAGVVASVIVVAVVDAAAAAAAAAAVAKTTLVLPIYSTIFIASLRVYLRSVDYSE